MEKFRKFFVVGGIVFGFFAVGIIYYFLSKPPVSIDGQDLGVYMNVKSLTLKNPGFLVIDTTSDPFNFMSGTGYLDKGKYKNFSVPFFFNFPNDNIVSFKARAFIYEDSDNNKAFNALSDKRITDIFGRPLIRRFTVYNKPTSPRSCQDGLDLLDSSKYIGATLEGNKVGLVASGNLANGDATIFYNKHIFTGDLALESELSSFIAQDHGVFEITMFTPSDRVFSVKLHNEDGKFYMTPAVGKMAAPLEERHELSGVFPLSIKIARVGDTGKVFLKEGDAPYQEIWTIPGISIENLYVGLEASDVGQIASEVTVEVNNFSLTCS